MSTKQLAFHALALISVAGLIFAFHEKANAADLEVDFWIEETSQGGVHIFTPPSSIISFLGNSSAPSCPAGQFFGGTYPSGNTGIRTYRGSYPDTSQPVTSVTGRCIEANASNPVAVGNWMEGGFQNGAGSTSDGDYWVRISNEDNTDAIYWQATRSGGIWSGGEPLSGNTVAAYLPSQNVATSSGVTTLGALFSVADFDAIDEIAYFLIDVNGNTVGFASSSPSSVGYFELTDDVSLSAGYYRGRGIIFTEAGGQIYPALDQIIAVDVEPVTVLSDGSFSFNNATTSTSTLSELTLNCGDGFIGSVCNLFETIIIPSPSSIGQVQNSWNGVLQNLPFSLFTEARNLLLAFQTGSAETGGNFSLELYGETVPIVSTSTAASVGLDSGAIDFLKFMMTIGLWILLAWYLYWRIASIFGV